MRIKWIRVLPGLGFWILLISFASSGWAVDSTQEEHIDVLIDFSPELSADESGFQDPLPLSDPWLVLSGNVKFSSAYQFAADPPEPGKTDFRRTNELKSSLFLRADMRVSPAFTAKVEATGFYNGIYRIRGRGHYTDQTLDTYESDSEIMNCYIAGQITDHMDIKLGRQVVTWGKSDSFRITDVLNPIDYREPGRKDLSESKIPVLMAKLDCYTGPFSLTIIGSFEHRWNRYPVFGSMFYPFDFPIKVEDGTSASFSDMDYAIALSTFLSGTDMSIYVANFRDTTPTLQMPFPLPVFKIDHARVKMVGTDINRAWKNLLFKAEAGFFSGIRFSDSLGASFHLAPVSNRTFDKTQVLFGVEYMGFKDTYLSFEATNTRINGYDDTLEKAGVSRNSTQVALKVIRTFLNGAATIILQSRLGVQSNLNGAIHKMEIRYDLSDDTTVSGGAIWFESGENFIYQNLEDKDMIFLDLCYYF